MIAGHDMGCTRCHGEPDHVQILSGDISNGVTRDAGGLQARRWDAQSLARFVEPEPSLFNRSMGDAQATTVNSARDLFR